MLRSLKSGGALYLSTLYNRWHPDVDLEILQKDKTRNGEYLYKVLSKSSIEAVLADMTSAYKFEVFDFNIDVNLPMPVDGGVGTYTISSGQNNLEISGGALFQWSFLRFFKE